MAIKIQIRGDDAAAWTAANPILSEREMGIEVDTNKFKFGDGVTAWNSLDYAVFRDITVFDTRVIATPSGGVLTLDCTNNKLAYFTFGSAASAPFSVSILNATNLLQFDVVMIITGSVAITMPAGSYMYQSDKDGGRWNDSTKVLTLVGLTASYFRVIFTKVGSDYLIEASPNFV